MEQKIQDDLKNDIQNLKMQLEESKQGLIAASRLSDQLEQSKKQVTTLKEEGKFHYYESITVNTVKFNFF